MKKIELTDEIKSTARDYAKRITKAIGDPKDSNYTGLNRTDQYYIGYLGELAFKTLLEAEGKMFTYDPKFNGVADTGDFTLMTVLDRGVTVDVKTAGEDFHKKLMLPKVQYAKANYLIYIGAKLDGDICEIHGWCYGSELTEEFVKIPTMSIPFSELKDIDDLLVKIQ